MKKKLPNTQSTFPETKDLQTITFSICQLHFKSKSNQIFHYTRCITPKRVTSLRGPSLRHCARATQPLSKKCRSGGEPLATLCPI